MQELYISAHTCRDEAGISHTFQYFLLQSESVYENRLCKDYGVMVRASEAEQVRIPHITTDHDRIVNLLSLLKTHGVSPAHLSDVIEDWL